MASRILLLAPRRALPLSIGVGISSFFVAQSFLAHPPRSLLVHCDSRPGFGLGQSSSKLQADTRGPVVRDGRINARTFRQLSAGSIAGLFGGMAVSVFSKPLAILIGLMVLGVQALESRGIHIIPYSRLQQYFQSVDIKSSLQENVPFKLSFGVTCALAAFAEF